VSPGAPAALPYAGIQSVVGGIPDVLLGPCMPILHVSQCHAGHGTQLAPAPPDDRRGGFRGSWRPRPGSMPSRAPLHGPTTHNTTATACRWKVVRNGDATNPLFAASIPSSAAVDPLTCGAEPAWAPFAFRVNLVQGERALLVFCGAPGPPTWGFDVRLSRDDRGGTTGEHPDRGIADGDRRRSVRDGCRRRAAFPPYAWSCLPPYYTSVVGQQFPLSRAVQDRTGRPMMAAAPVVALRVPVLRAVTRSAGRTSNGRLRFDVSGLRLPGDDEHAHDGKSDCASLADLLTYTGDIYLTTTPIGRDHSMGRKLTAKRRSSGFSTTCCATEASRSRYGLGTLAGE